MFANMISFMSQTARGRKADEIILDEGAVLHPVLVAGVLPMAIEVGAGVTILSSQDTSESGWFNSILFGDGISTYKVQFICDTCSKKQLTNCIHNAHLNPEGIDLANNAVKTVMDAVDENAWQREILGLEKYCAKRNLKYYTENDVVSTFSSSAHKDLTSETIEKIDVIIVAVDPVLSTSYASEAASVVIARTEDDLFMVSNNLFFVFFIILKIFFNLQREFRKIEQSSRVWDP